PAARREQVDERGVGVRHLDPVELQPELACPTCRLDVEVPADLEMVRDETDWADEHAPHALCLELLEVVHDVGAEPGLTGRRSALEREGPVADACCVRDLP